MRGRGISLAIMAIKAILRSHAGAEERGEGVDCGECHWHVVDTLSIDVIAHDFNHGGSVR